MRRIICKNADADVIDADAAVVDSDAGIDADFICADAGVVADTHMEIIGGRAEARGCRRCQGENVKVEPKMAKLSNWWIF